MKPPVKGGGGGGGGEGNVPPTRLLAGATIVFSGSPLARALVALPQLSRQLRRVSWTIVVELSLDVTSFVSLCYFAPTKSKLPGYAACWDKTIKERRK